MDCCIETIRIANRQLDHIQAHEARMYRTRSELWGCTDFITLRDIITIPTDLSNNTHKCRIIYDMVIHQTMIEPYTIRTIRSIQLVTDDTIDYRYKWLDRSRFAAHQAQTDADDILIVKGGYLTDTSYANIAFFDGNRWLTPSMPLLSGVRRQRLLHAGILTEAPLQPSDLPYFQSARLLNAMLPWSESPILPMSVFLF